MVVTHLPQVAGKGHQHMVVSKHTDGKTTETQMQALDQGARLNELARLLGIRSPTIPWPTPANCWPAEIQISHLHAGPTVRIRYPVTQPLGDGGLRLSNWCIITMPPLPHPEDEESLPWRFAWSRLVWSGWGILVANQPEPRPYLSACPSPIHLLQREPCGDGRARRRLPRGHLLPLVSLSGLPPSSSNLPPWSASLSCPKTIQQQKCAPFDHRVSPAAERLTPVP